LVEGDADANGVIDIHDFSVLATSLRNLARRGFRSTGRLYNTFNIDILDFSLLATNYGRSGEVIVTATDHAPPASR
jgi:hypothetical protein